VDEAPTRSEAAAAIRDWLIDDAGFLGGPADVLQGLCERLVAVGLPLARATAHIRVLHSERFGMTSVWRRGQPAHEQAFAFGPGAEETYRRSPIRVVHETRQRLELHPADPVATEYGITADLKAEGITHYALFPLLFAGGHVNVATFATNHADGFAHRDLAFIELFLPAFARVMEIKGLLRSRRDLLEIYVGRLPAARILDGQIRRGDVVELDAAILLCDLRGSTQLAIEQDETAFVRTLNGYFECVVPAVTRAGGEVLKFIGDAVLAIFVQPERGDERLNCTGALAATEAIFAALDELNAHDRQPGGLLRVAVALHVGRVAFGNIGAVERQDFTVIGQDVNLATRLCGLSADLNERLLVSEAAAMRCAVPLRKLGEFQLKGFAAPQSVFATVPVTVLTQPS
jgi:adenylate cyclase